MKKIIKLTESDLRRIVRRVIQEQGGMATLPASEIPNNIPNNISNEVQELELKREDLKAEFEKLNKRSGGLMGRVKNKMGDLEDSVIEEVNSIKTNIEMKLDDIKRTLTSIRMKSQQKKQDKRNEREIEMLEREIEKYEKSIEQVKNKKIVTANDLKNFLDIAKMTSPFMVMIGSIIARFRYMRNDDRNSEVNPFLRD
jgi:DNA repair exonuclease SbcCD ATPase subunit